MHYLSSGHFFTSSKFVIWCVPQRMCKLQGALGIFAGTSLSTGSSLPFAHNASMYMAKHPFFRSWKKGPYCGRFGMKGKCACNDLFFGNCNKVGIVTMKDGSSAGTFNLKCANPNTSVFVTKARCNARCIWLHLDIPSSLCVVQGRARNTVLFHRTLLCCACSLLWRSPEATFVATP